MGPKSDYIQVPEVVRATDERACGERGAPVRVPLGLKSSPSSVTHRVRTSLLNARDFAVAESCN